MKSKRVAAARKLSLLQMELDLIREDMIYGMQRANPEYVMTGRTTPYMDSVLARFYDWARRYEEACE